MKTRMTGVHLAMTTAIIGALMFAGTAKTATAAPQGRDAFVVNVPFAFVAGDKTLPAGRYRVAFLPDETEPDVMATLQTAASAKSDRMVFQSVPIERVDIEELGTNDGQPRLVFSKVGGRYFLEKIETQ